MECSVVVSYGTCGMAALSWRVLSGWGTSGLGAVWLGSQGQASIGWFSLGAVWQPGLGTVGASRRVLPGTGTSWFGPAV